MGDRSSNNVKYEPSYQTLVVYLGFRVLITGSEAQGRVIAQFFDKDGKQT